MLKKSCKKIFRLKTCIPSFQILIKVLRSYIDWLIFKFKQFNKYLYLNLVITQIDQSNCDRLEWLRWFDYIMSRQIHFFERTPHPMPIHIHNNNNANDFKLRGQVVPVVVHQQVELLSFLGFSSKMKRLGQLLRFWTD